MKKADVAIIVMVLLILFMIAMILKSLGETNDKQSRQINMLESKVNHITMTARKDKKIADENAELINNCKIAQMSDGAWQKILLMDDDPLNDFFSSEKQGMSDAEDIKRIATWKCMEGLKE